MNEGTFPGFSAGRPVELYLPEIIHEETLQASGAFDIRDIPLIYDKFYIELVLRGTVSAANDIVYLYANGDLTAANYSCQRAFFAGTGTFNSRADIPDMARATAGTAPADAFARSVVEIINPQDTIKTKTATTSGELLEAAATFDRYLMSWNWENTAPITRIQIRTDNHPTDLFVKGSMVRLIGWRRFRLQP